MRPRLNEQIEGTIVQLIDYDGNEVGVVLLRAALARARELNLDLVEVDPTARPPVCAILDGTGFGDRSPGGRGASRQNVLFVCLHNSARSQMAAALFARATRYEHVVESAGTHASDGIHPLVIEAMREVGVDLSGRKPRQLDTLLVGCADVIVRCLAPDPDDYPWGACRARFIDWELPMPSDEDNPTREEIRKLRDAIEARVRDLVL